MWNGEEQRCQDAESDAVNGRARMMNKDQNNMIYMGSDPITHAGPPALLQA
jgi:hypothetical protein